MKKIFYMIILLVNFGLSIQAYSQTVTSVANGAWTSPATWGGIPPMPGSTVIINHTVILDLDYGYSSGSITINSTGALNGNSLTRALAISGGALTVNGSLNIPRLALFAGTIINSGTLHSDSLYCTTSLTNNNGGGINSTMFMMNTGGTFNNNGDVISTDLLNLSTVSNSGLITAYDLKNSKSFTNASSGNIDISHNFLNSDSLAGPAIFSNDGRVTVHNDWRNSTQMNGSGKFCIQNNTNNSGAMTGTFDFCDLSGGGIDLNTGTVAGTITYCLYSCYTVITNNSTPLINLFPNPNNGVFSLTIIPASKDLEIFNVLGELIYSQHIDSEKSVIDLSSQGQGIYFYRIKNENGIANTGKIICE